MRKNITLAGLALLGLLMGWLVGTAGGVSGQGLFWEIFWGTTVGYSLGLAILKQEKGIIIGSVFGLAISFVVDWLAGSSVDIKQKLVFIGMCGFVGWGFGTSWKYNLIGTLVGGTIGFAWGLQQSHWFGTICLPAGILNASLLAIQISIIGTAIASLFFKSAGEGRFVIKHSQVK